MSRPTFLRRAVAVLSVAGATAAASLVLATGADAATSGPCSVTLSPNSAPTTGSAVCKPVSYKYRIHITCHDGINGVNYNVYGKYVSSGQRSTASCGAPQRQTISEFDIQKQ